LALFAHLPAAGLDDICVRFIINLPKEEFQSVERIIFQIEEGHWYHPRSRP
jgi:mRNA-decapping enzyme subunit 2